MTLVNYEGRDCPDYDDLKQRAKEEKVPTDSLIALSPGNDPFYIGPARQTGAEWFAGLWQANGFGRGTHLRRVHYILVSSTAPVGMPPNGEPYQNTEKCWSYLGACGRDARYLGLIRAGDFVDRRNPEPQVFLVKPEAAKIMTTEGGKLKPLKVELPSLAALVLRDEPVIPQRYHVEI
jgi:hypothetical protein